MHALQFLYFVLLVLFNPVADSLNILALFPHPGKSHVDVFLPLTTGLARRGHNVTVVSHFPLKSPMKNYTDISLANKVRTLVNVIDLEEVYGYSILAKAVLEPLYLGDLGYNSCAAGYSSKEVQNLLKSKSQFDLIIAEFFNNDCFLGFLRKFKAPLIGFSSCVLMPWTNDRLANPDNPSYIPNLFLSYSDKMTFIERVFNTLDSVYDQIVYKYLINRWDEKLIYEHLGRKHPSLDEITRNTSLVLVNSHFSLNFARPLVPGFIEIGGIHVGKPNPLPKDIEKWINDSPDGVIYFSLGSMIKGHTFPDHKRQAFLKAFGKFKQRVLWKWENETMPDKPDNVMIKKWMPQFDILCHPNVRAFISHGGLLGTIEAVHCGVPVIVMPQYGDQHTNARALEANGGGVVLYLSDATEETVTKALRKVLNSDFRQKAKELSERFRDRPMSPLDTAIYWVEYVARHRGAPHLRTAAVDMPWYAYHLIDVWLFLITVTLIGIYISVKIGLILLRCFAKFLSKEKVKKA